MAVGRSSFGLVLLLAACIPALLVSASDPDPLADFVGTREILFQKAVLFSLSGCLLVAYFD